jgi:hypothetical protein
VRRARTPVAQRNVLLDSANEMLAGTEHQLAAFMSLDVPSARASRHRNTAAAWRDLVARLRGHAQRLDLVADRRDLQDRDEQAARNADRARKRSPHPRSWPQ